jgi:hypothetical protein
MNLSKVILRLFLSDDLLKEMKEYYQVDLVRKELK